MQIVFNLYPISEHHYLPSANIIRRDAGGEFTHFVQRATAVTAAGQGLTIRPEEAVLLKTIDALSPKALEARFKPPKAKAPTPLAKLLADAATKPVVEAYLARELDQFLTQIVRHNLPLTLDAERKTLAKDVLITPAAEELIPHLSFTKTAEGIEYRLQLGTETEKWRISQHNVIPLTNTNPAWLLVGYALFRVPGINGNMVRPFRQRDVLPIPQDKMRTYFRTFIAKKAGRTRIEAEGFAMQITDRLLTTRLELSENILTNTWLIQPVFEYEGAEFAANDRRDLATAVDFSEDDEDVVVRQTARHAVHEAARLQWLTEHGLVDDQKLFHPADMPATLENALQWLTDRRAELEVNHFTVTAPEAQGRTLALLPGRLTVDAKAEDDWFDVHGEVVIGLHRFPFRALLPHLRQRDPFFPLPDGTFFLIPEAWFARYADLALAIKDNAQGLRLPRALFTLVQDAGLAASESAAFPEIDPSKVEYAPSPLLKAALRPYQLLGVKWLIGHYQSGFGACLADDMGLGKTLQTIAALLYAKERRVADGAPTEAPAPQGGQFGLFQDYQSELLPLQALVILPASLVFNWQKELERFAPSLFVFNHTGPKRHKDIRALAGFDIVLTTYHTARQDLDLLGQLTWHVVVLDESQQIKNRESEVSKVVRGLAARHKISLSGTPIENSLADLWTQMEFINPAALGSYRSFREQFQLPIEKGGDAAARQKLFGLVRPFFLRRTKREVAPDLPALTEQIFYTEMTSAQRKQYEKVKSAVRNEVLALSDDPKNQFLVIQALTRLRQLANHPVLTDAEYTGGSGKFDDVLAQWDTVRRAGGKALFFSAFEKNLQLFRAALEEREQPYAWLTGDTEQAARAAAVERFQTDPTVQAFLMTTKAGGVGLNLTAADYVFLLDPWWNPAAEEQAIARAHRIGQMRPVTAIRFIAQDTIEEKILALQERKKALGAGLFSADADHSPLSRAELEEVLA